MFGVHTRVEREDGVESWDFTPGHELNRNEIAYMNRRRREGDYELGRGDMVRSGTISLQWEEVDGVRKLYKYMRLQRTDKADLKFCANGYVVSQA